ncbi:envelope protein, partial [Lynx pardinus]
KQQTKRHNAMYQNQLALDDLPASEGGVCGKFNLSNCCLQIDDKEKVIEENTDQMRKVAHVPVQTWK